MEAAGRTVVLQKEGGILPIDHLVDARPEMKKPQFGRDLYTQCHLMVALGGADT